MKPGNVFTTFLLWLPFIFSIHPCKAQTYEVSGHAFLENQTVHDSIMIGFERFAPYAYYDTTYTDSSGGFVANVPPGLYNIKYSREGYDSIYLEDVQCYSNILLPDTTLQEQGLSGNLSGILAAGDYLVTGIIQIPPGESLIIEPGTTLRFEEGTRFDVLGSLQAVGTAEDSIIFTHADQQSYWKGIFLNSDAEIGYAVIEFSEATGIVVIFCDPEIHHTTVRYNQNIEYPNQGGGIYLSYTECFLHELAVYGNQASLGAGIYLFNVQSVQNDPARAVVANSLVYDNTASSDGSGVYFEYWNYAGTDRYPLLINSTVVNNHGGGAVSGSGSTWLPRIINNVIAFNDGYGVKSDLGMIKYFGYNDVSGNSSGNFYNPPEWIGQNITINASGDSCDAYNNIQFDPAFADLQNNDFHLLSESPCLDVGFNDSVVSAVDFDGNDRILEVINGPIVDMGAYESLSLGVIPKTTSNYFPLEFVPNPARDNIRIDWTGSNFYNTGKLLVLDASGIEVMDIPLNGTSSSQPVDTRQFPPGIYEVILYNHGLPIGTGRFVVVK